jgi:hypothetical protein
VLLHSAALFGSKLAVEITAQQLQRLRAIIDQDCVTVPETTGSGSVALIRISSTSKLVNERGPMTRPA